MKTKLPIAALLFVAGVFAGNAASTILPPLTSSQRAELVDKFRFFAATNHETANMFRDVPGSETLVTSIELRSATWNEAASLLEAFPNTP